MKIATDEIFGPVQSILKFKNIDEVSTAVSPWTACSGWQPSCYAPYWQLCAGRGCTAQEYCPAVSCC